MLSYCRIYPHKKTLIHKFTLFDFAKFDSCSVLFTYIINFREEVAGIAKQNALSADSISPRHSSNAWICVAWNWHWHNATAAAPNKAAAGEMPALVGWDDPKENVAGSLETSVSSQCCQKPEWLEHQQILLQEKSLKKQPVPCQCPLQVAKEEVSRGKRPRGAAILHRSLVSAAHCKIPSIHDIKSAPSLSRRNRHVNFEGFLFSELRIRVHWSMVLVATVENLLVVNRDTSRSQPSSGKKSMSSGRSPVSACLQARLAVSTGPRWRVAFWMWQEISCSLPNKWLKVLEGYQTQPQT